MGSQVRWSVLVGVCTAVLAGCSSGGQTRDPFDPLPIATDPAAVTPGTTGGADAGSSAQLPGAQPGAGTDETMVAATDPVLPTFPTTTTTTTSTTVYLLTTKGATVVVANASKIDGSARRFSNQLKAKGFTMGDPTSSALFEVDLKRSRIYVLSGGESVARSIAHLMGGVDIEYMPIPVPIQGGQGKLGKATVLVMLGSDWASKRLP